MHVYRSTISEKLKVDYLSKAKSSIVHYFAPPIGTVDTFGQTFYLQNVLVYVLDIQLDRLKKKLRASCIFYSADFKFLSNLLLHNLTVTLFFT
jgi:hypothetical protein